MKIPKRVKIGGVTYTVRIDKPRYASDGQMLHGEVTYLGAEIYLNDTQSKDVMPQTFLHEVVHVVMHMMGRKDLNEDEYFIDALSYNLHQIMSDNGWMMGKDD